MAPAGAFHLYGNLNQLTDTGSIGRNLGEDTMARKPTRDVFHSTPNPDGKGWVVEKSGEVISRHRTQENAERAAVKAGNAAEAAGGLGQAVLHKADGKIREERTYGNDPRKTPG